MLYLIFYQRAATGITGNPFMFLSHRKWCKNPRWWEHSPSLGASFP